MPVRWLLLILTRASARPRHRSPILLLLLIHRLQMDGKVFCYTRHEPVGVCGQVRARWPVLRDVGPSLLGGRFTRRLFVHSFQPHSPLWTHCFW